MLYKDTEFERLRHSPNSNFRHGEAVEYDAENGLEGRQNGVLLPPSICIVAHSERSWANHFTSLCFNVPIKK